MTPLSDLNIAIAVVFVVGLLLFGIGRALMRPDEASGQPSWPSLVDEALADADAALRMDVIERLGLVGSAWSREILERAAEQEQDGRVRSAVAEALNAASNENT